MDDDYEFADQFYSKGKVITKDANGNVIIKDAEDGGKQGLIVMCVIVGAVLLFMVGSYVFYTYANKTFPKRKKQPVSKKKMKRERLKQGISAPGD